MQYNEQMILDNRKQSKKYAIISIVLGVLAITLIIVTAFFIKPATILVIQIVDSIVLSLVASIIAYFVIQIFIPNSRRNAVIDNIIRSKVKMYEGEIVKIEKDLHTINHDEKVYLVSISVNNKNHVLYLDRVFELEKEKLTGSVRLVTQGNYITEIINL